MKISIKDSAFDEVFQDVGVENGFIRMELFSFREPIYQFFLEDNAFSGFDAAWATVGTSSNQTFAI